MAKTSDDPKTFDDSLVRDLATILDDTDLTEIVYELGELKVRVTREPAPVTAYAAPAPAPMAVPAPAAPQALPAAGAAPAVEAPEDFSKHPGLVKSPMVGVVYLQAEPGTPAFVTVDDSVTQGDTLCLIEAMKTFNPVRADKSGKVTRILVSDGVAVEFGEPLMIVE